MTRTSPKRADHDVRGLEVAVHDRAAVRVSDRLGDLREDPEELALCRAVLPRGSRASDLALDEP